MSGKPIEKTLITAAEWSSALLPLLEEGYSLHIPVEGLSMYPLLVGGRDSVIISSPSRSKLQRGDIVLFVRKDGTHVLHRVYDIKNDMYYMLGDAQTWVEGPIANDAIRAVADSIVRKGRKIKLRNSPLQRISIIWMYLRPLRPPILSTISSV